MQKLTKEQIVLVSGGALCYCRGPDKTVCREEVCNAENPNWSMTILVTGGAIADREECRKQCCTSLNADFAGKIFSIDRYKTTHDCKDDAGDL